MGPLVFLVLLGFDSVQTVMPIMAWRVMAVAAWMALWWATEAIDVAATALLPLILLPLLGIKSLAEASIAYASPTIYLFLGAFILAAGIERWSLHQRLALALLSVTGTEGRRLIGGMMLAAALLSMWMTNTSTTMMLLPIVISIVKVVINTSTSLSHRQQQHFQITMLLGLAYAATLGGLATVIGTPPNVLLVAFLAKNYDINIEFLDWLLLGVPLLVILLPLTWWLLTTVIYPINIAEHPDVLKQLAVMRNAQGAIKSAEIRVAIVFGSVVMLWMVKPLLVSILGWEFLSDTFIALCGALLLFVIPSGDVEQTRLIVWGDLRHLPWGILLLFGGGLSLAAAFSSSGLALWLGEALSPLGRMGVVAMIVCSVALVIFLTELTSNVATAATFLPVVAAIAVDMEISPLLLAVPVALASSCAFMLPVATAPNAIVFSSGRLSVPQMVRVGFWINIISIVTISVLSAYLVPWLFSL